jgi:hypothetical protein
VGPDHPVPTAAASAASPAPWAAAASRWAGMEFETARCRHLPAPISQLIAAHARPDTVTHDTHRETRDTVTLAQDGPARRVSRRLLIKCKTWHELPRALAREGTADVAASTSWPARDLILRPAAEPDGNTVDMTSCCVQDLAPRHDRGQRLHGLDDTPVRTQFLSTGALDAAFLGATHVPSSDSRAERYDGEEICRYSRLS